MLFSIKRILDAIECGQRSESTFIAVMEDQEELYSLPEHRWMKSFPACVSSNTSPSPSFRGTMVNLCHLATTPSTSLRSAYWQSSRPSLTTPSWSLSWKSSWQPHDVLSLCLVAGRIQQTLSFTCVTSFSYSSDLDLYEAWICHLLFFALEKVKLVNVVG